MMVPAEQFLDELMDAFALTPPASDELSLVVTEIDLDLPVEARIDRDGMLLLTLSRGLLATGIANPLSRLRIHCGEQPS